MSTAPHGPVAGSPGPMPTHVFGGTLVPSWMVPVFYRPIGRRLAAGGPVTYHAMAPYGGLGRTDRIVDSYLPLLERTAAAGGRVRLAGHSLGGVVAWALAQEYPEVVDTVEVWAAPLRGTSIARFLHNLGAEARFLSPGSRWLRRYDRPLSGPVGRSVYTACDALVLPVRESCYMEGERVANHFLTPVPLPFGRRRPAERVHTGLADHILLPRHRGMLAAVA
ncbi:MAG TPA: hypothetical protein VFH45_11655 [Acidimicrobiales bacterium]|nr:hypothetical protein [Acidimicrobiales bacterium]